MWPAAAKVEAWSLLVDRLPEPPRDKPAALPGLAVVDLPLWRIHAEPNPLRRRASARAIHRFDAPNGEYAVTYANQDRQGVFGERFGEIGRIKAQDRPLRLSRITPHRPLRLIPLDLAATQLAFGLDGRICVSKQYPTTRRWGFAFHEWYPKADGIQYTARLASPYLNVCLFLDRCAGKLGVARMGTLGALRMDVLHAGATYNLAIDWLLPGR